MNQCFERLSDRRHGDEVIITRARARAHFLVVFSNMAAKKMFFSNKFFFVSLPEIHMYAKNEVYRSKNEEKAL